MCALYAQNDWISRKIEYPKLLIFKRKLCTLYMYGMYGVAEKLNVQNFIIEYLEPPKFNEKLCTLHMYGMSGLA